MRTHFILFLLHLQRFGIHCLNEECTKNTECAGNAICNNGKCSCDQLSYFNNRTCLSFVTEYKAFCKERKQCEWLGDNADCIKDVCVCEKNYRWYQGRCQKFVKKGENCKNHVDCYDGIDSLALKCSSFGICTCNTDYYDRGPDCRKASKDKNCALDIDCVNENLMCHLGTCTKQSDHLGEVLLYENTEYGNDAKRTNKMNMENTIIESSTCQTDEDCRDIANSVCHQDTKTCQCNSETHFFHDGNCLPGFSICSEDDDCRMHSNTHCFQDVCVCKQGFFLNDRTCAPELGMVSNITKEADCPMKPAKVQDKACFCRDYWFADDTNRNCIKTTLQQTLSCLNNDWCNVMGPNSYCNSNNQCQCSSFAKLNETNFYCEGFGTVDCLRDSECGFNERCQYEECACIENFSKDSLGFCQPDLGGSCYVQPCSNIENSKCREGVCVCDTNYVDKQNKCLKIAQNWNDTCEVSDQCLFDFSECRTNKKKCSCITGYKQIDQKCWQNKEYGDPCMNELECTKVLNRYYQCRNSKCMCPIGQTLESGYCVISSSHNTLPSLILVSLLLYTSFSF